MAFPAKYMAAKGAWTFLFSPADLEVTVTGFQGLQRHFMLGLIQCAGMRAMGPMDVRTVTHVLAEDVAAPSEKLAAARKP